MSTATSATQALDSLRTLCANNPEVMGKMMRLLQAMSRSAAPGAEPVGICYPYAGVAPFPSTKSQCDSIAGIWSGTGRLTLSESEEHIEGLMESLPKEAGELNELCKGDKKEVIRQVVQALHAANKDHPAEPIGMCVLLSGAPPFASTQRECARLDGWWSLLALPPKEGQI